MDKKSLEKFKKLLQQQKKQLEQELSSFAEKDPNIKDNWETKFPKFGDHTDPEGGSPEEAGDEVEEYVNRLPAEYALELKLKETNKALERIKNNTYGKCENCKKNIPAKRLEALPEATLCLNCKK